MRWLINPKVSNWNMETYIDCSPNYYRCPLQVFRSPASLSDARPHQLYFRLGTCNRTQTGRRGALVQTHAGEGPAAHCTTLEKQYGYLNYEYTLMNYEYIYFCAMDKSCHSMKTLAATYCHLVARLVSFQTLMNLYLLWNLKQDWQPLQWTSMGTKTVW